MRFILQYLLPLLLPLLVYLGFVWLSRGRSQAWLAETPWVPLLAAGAVLTALSLIAWSLFTGASTEALYVPPHVEDGELVPGQTIEPERTF